MIINKFFSKISSKKNVDFSEKKNFDFPVNEIFYWRPLTGGHNFGDHLAKIIVNKVLATHGHMVEEEVNISKKIFSVGSVLHFAKNDNVIWGSGINGKKMSLEDHQYKTLDVRAVRGPLTRNFLNEKNIFVPEIYGDPALLLPYIFPGRFKKNSKKSISIVPNLHDLPKIKNKTLHNIISPFSSWNKCIKEILEAELIISSSLHGIIIAEAYGVPARYVRLSETENMFKYNDYMLGTGRSHMEAANNIDEAIEMGGMSPLVFNPTPLLNAFPIDLWRN